MKPDRKGLMTVKSSLGNEFSSSYNKLFCGKPKRHDSASDIRAVHRTRLVQDTSCRARAKTERDVRPQWLGAHIKASCQHT